MPIAAQNPITVDVNAVMVPMIVIQSRINPTTKKLVTSAIIQLRGASVNENEEWMDGGVNGTVSIPDLENLPADLSTLAPQVGAAFTDLVILVAAINSIRKVV
jgi:hypothetical protein